MMVKNEGLWGNDGGGTAMVSNISEIWSIVGIFICDPLCNLR